MAIPYMTFTAKTENSINHIITALDHVAEDVIGSEPAMVAEITDLLEAAIREDFGQKHPGRPDEDRGGEFEGRYGGGFWGDQRPRTLDTMRKEAHGMVGRITIAGGAPYIEFGTQSHMVQPRGQYPLHWRKDGVDFFSGGHEVSGTKQDDFVERAFRKIEGESLMAAVFTKTFLKIAKEME